ncbi:MAG: bifunctional 2-polyprenyl-6-hydroxyphenol methylase/3-demethylubiquinol 3-O-methyltransferase UbiG [Gammaproteobacteria bacterium]|jgi:2-polyprenyl-6-hydroxyphenyl methylase / 3-demethylubiquinone-9 3-methyltransferase|nr:bifunctional 2-polyprenyl-6-hydroxyphenol methylase/3-demethylubiquinol 3-O-methyltransferase UbiG [Gammaproteobacteria bacterium]
MSVNIHSTQDPVEIAKFNRLADLWWDPDGQMWPLHRLNHLRTPFVAQEMLRHFGTDSLQGLRVLDIGCGAGLLAEPLARQGASVTGIDVAGKNIAIARQHARSAGLNINYLHGAVEDLEPGETFDVILNMEVIEHVNNLPMFMERSCRLTHPSGLMFLATINRTWFSWLTTIVGAEYLLRWMPRGTHDWQRYVTPEDAEASLRQNGLSVKSKTGVGMNPFTRQLFITRNMAANYMMVATRS